MTVCTGLAGVWDSPFSASLAFLAASAARFLLTEGGTHRALMLKDGGRAARNPLPSLDLTTKRSTRSEVRQKVLNMPTANPSLACNTEAYVRVRGRQSNQNTLLNRKLANFTPPPDCETTYYVRTRSHRTGSGRV